MSTFVFGRAQQSSSSSSSSSNRRGHLPPEELARLFARTMRKELAMLRATLADPAHGGGGGGGGGGYSSSDDVESRAAPASNPLAAACSLFEDE
jgi:hypothetical protein